MREQEQKTKKTPPEKEPSLTVTERKKRAWGVGEPDEGARRIGIRTGRRQQDGGHPFGTVTALDRWFVRKILEVANHPPINIALWDGKLLNSVEQPVATLRFHDRMAIWKLALNPELHFGDLYSAGRISLEGDLVRFLEEVYSGLKRNGQQGWFRRLLKWLGHRRIANSLARARDNIYHHYDLSNDFYQLWLDKVAMQYTCSYFPDPQMSLEESQTAKLHHICRKLQLQPGDTVVEAGCGWGGLARFMARHYGVTVKAYNISREQLRFAREQAQQQGLADQVEYIEDDYRNIRGKFDVFVSVGMLEHVGTPDYTALGDVIDRCLKPDGRGLIHTIGRNVAGPMNPWIERRIFPGAYPPSLREMMDIFEPHRFSIQDVENLRLHYARTLRHWLDRFEENAGTVREMFDEEFVRAWRLYLCGSIAAFTSGELQLFQVVFNRAAHNDLPWSRAYLYQQDSGVAGQ
ncbi:MAG: class I SAM-dependent methyltransferase [Thiohalophilus sp.]